MVRVKEIKDNPRCVASITVRIHTGSSSMKIGEEQHKILSIFRTSVNT